MTQLYPPPAHTGGVHPEDEWQRYQQQGGYPQQQQQQGGYPQQQQQQGGYPYPPGVFRPSMPDVPPRKQAPFLRHQGTIVAAVIAIAAVIGMVGWFLVAGRSAELNPGKMYDTVGAPCPGAEEHTSSPETPEARRLVNLYGPDEAVVRDRLSQIHSPNHNAADVLEEVKKVKIAVLWAWANMRTTASDLDADPTDATVEDEMQESRKDFDEAIDRYIANLDAGTVPSKDTATELRFRELVCPGG